MNEASSSLWTAECESGAAIGRLRLLAGTSTVLEDVECTIITGSTYTITVCLADGRFSASVSDACVSVDLATPAAPRYGGLGSGAVGSNITFDNFTLDKGLDDATPDCGDECVACPPATDTSHQPCCDFETLPDSWNVLLPFAYTDDNDVCGACTDIGGTYHLVREPDAGAATLNCGNVEGYEGVAKWSYYGDVFCTTTGDPNACVGEIEVDLILTILLELQASATTCQWVLTVSLATNFPASSPDPGAFICWAQGYLYSFTAPVDCSDPDGFTLPWNFLPSSDCACVTDRGMSAQLLPH